MTGKKTLQIGPGSFPPSALYPNKTPMASSTQLLSLSQIKLKAVLIVRLWERLKCIRSQICDRACFARAAVSRAQLGETSSRRGRGERSQACPAPSNSRTNHLHVPLPAIGPVALE